MIKQKNYSLKNLTTMGVGGIVKELFIINNINDLIKVISSDKYFVIGNGSNVVFDDKFYDFKIIKLKGEFDFINFKDKEKCIIEIGAGTDFKKIINFFIKQGITGFEWAVGIPATLGGMIYNNAGAYGKCISDNLIKVISLDKNNYMIKEYNKKELMFGYRTSKFKLKKEEIILKAEYSLKYSEKNTVKNSVKDFLSKRYFFQPLKQKSAGSVFLNYNNYKIAKLLDDAGLKGYKIGNMMFSSLHSNFIINIGDGTFNDFYSLINYAKKVIYQKYGFKPNLEIEVIYEN